MGTLSPGEVVVWTGAPRRGPVFERGAAKSLVVVGYAVVMVALAFFFAPDGLHRHRPAAADFHRAATVHFPGEPRRADGDSRSGWHG
jgi:hypothetical protein